MDDYQELNERCDKILSGMLLVMEGTTEEPFEEVIKHYNDSIILSQEISKKLEHSSEDYKSRLSGLNEKVIKAKESIEEIIPKEVLTLNTELNTILSDPSDSETPKYDNLGEYLVKLLKEELNQDDALLSNPSRDNDYKKIVGYINALKKKARSERNKSVRIIYLRGF